MQEPTEPRDERRSFRRAMRGWSGRPLALALGWIMSCALVTAVTLTAVNRVGHEVAGSSPRVFSQAGASAQASEQSASAASAASAKATDQSPSPTAAILGKPTVQQTQSQPRPHQSQTSAPTSPTPVTPPASTSPKPSESPSSSSPTAPTSAPASTVQGSGSASPSATASPPQSGTPFYVPKDSPTPYGFIKIVCSGNSITGTVKLLDSAYGVTPKSLSDPRVDIVFSNGSQNTEYVYTCNNGSAFGGQVIPERP